jgi:ABC-2 type transport system ATP-binding protein
MIEVTHLTKRYGATTAVDDLSFTVRPGIVTGFLGPNGAGKSTTMRMILGLDSPTAGSATIAGRSLREHPAPLTELGALLEAKAMHPRRSAYNHLRALATTTGIPPHRVDEVLDLVGLTDVAGRAAGQFSLGMSQRLGIASALLGDPATIMLDEPVNGLDPEGILWIRGLLRRLAAEGRTVFVSSHLMSEMALTAEHFVIIGRGRLIADVTARELEAMAPRSDVVVRTPHGERLRAALALDGVTVADDSPSPSADINANANAPGDIARGESPAYRVVGLPAEEIGRRAAQHDIELHELTTRRASLEQTFMDLTHDSVQYGAPTIPTPDTLSVTDRKAA